MSTSPHPSRLPGPAALPLVALVIQVGLLGGALLVAWLVPEASHWPLLLILALSSLNLVVVSLALRRWLQQASLGEPGRLTLSAEAGRSGPEGEAGDASRDGGLRRRLQELEGDLAQRQRRLERLETGRERARQESRLKSDYLALLGRELQLMMEQLDRLLDAQPTDGREAVRRTLRELRALRERLGDLDSLLQSLVGEQEQDATPPQRAARVLIVDDGPVNLMLARQVLERQGVEVEVATSGSEALARLDRGPFDLVLMDIFMPGMDGMETSRRWRREEAGRYPDRRSVLIALTANASDEDRQRFREAGMDDYLAKPYRPQELVDRVRYWLPDRFKDSRC